MALFSAHMIGHLMLVMLAPALICVGHPLELLLLAIAMAVDTFTGVALITTTRALAMVAVPGLTVDPLSDTHAGGAIMWVGGDGLMVVVMVALTVGFLRRPDMVLRDRTSWVEQIRQSVFAEKVGASAGPVDPEFDDADANRDRYNQWLAALHESAEGKPQR